MNLIKKAVLYSLIVVTTLVFSITIRAEEPNWRRGQIYFKMDCNGCHVDMADKIIPADLYTMAEWQAYLDKDQHDKSGRSDPKLNYYVSRDYRESVQETNDAARLFLHVQEEELFADLKAFVIRGAKDSDNPASCD